MSAVAATRSLVPGSTTNLRQGELDTPDLALVAETILANELEFGVPRT